MKACEFCKAIAPPEKIGCNTYGYNDVWFVVVCLSLKKQRIPVLCKHSRKACLRA